MRRFSKLGVIALMSIFLAGCSKEEVPTMVRSDNQGLYINLMLSDANGNDLLNPDNVNAVNFRDIKVSFANSTALVSGPYVSDSNGVEVPHLYQAKTDGPYSIQLGTWDVSSKSFKDTVFIDWGDGSSDVFYFHYSYNAIHRYKTECTSPNPSFTVSGTPVRRFVGFIR